MLYRLPELLAADSAEPVYVTEGEKDVERLRALGLVATCNAGGGGGGKWSLAHARHFRGRTAIIIPDNDRTGEEHAEDVAARLHEQGAEIRVLRLPNLPRKGDVSDWLEAGGTADELSRLSEQAAPWRPTLPELSFDAVDAAAYETARNRRRVLTCSLTAVEKLLLIILLEPDHACCPQRTMANYLGVTERRVRQLIAGLKERGVLDVVRQRPGNSYHVQSYKLPERT
jgi:DNA primase